MAGPTAPGTAGPPPFLSSLQLVTQDLVPPCYCPRPAPFISLRRAGEQAAAGGCPAGRRPPPRLHLPVAPVLPEIPTISPPTHHARRSPLGEPALCSSPPYALPPSNEDTNFFPPPQRCTVIRHTRRIGGVPASPRTATTSKRSLTRKKPKVTSALLITSPAGTGGDVRYESWRGHPERRDGFAPSRPVPRRSCPAGSRPGAATSKPNEKLKETVCLLFRPLPRNSQRFHRGGLRPRSALLAQPEMNHENARRQIEATAQPRGLRRPQRRGVRAACVQLLSSSGSAHGHPGRSDERRVLLLLRGSGRGPK